MSPGGRWRVVRMTQSRCPLVPGGAVPRVVGGRRVGDGRLGGRTPRRLGARALNELWQEQLVR